MAPLITNPTWIFLVMLLVLLLAPIIFRRLHVPHIIGLILAGVVLGEHGFNILARDASFELFGQVGIYYIMFLAGLEMDMGSFRFTSLALSMSPALTAARTCSMIARTWSLWVTSRNFSRSHGTHGELFVC